MATILLNGVATDANSITGTDLADKLTVSGGVDGLEVQMSGGDDAVEIYADSENISGSVIRMGEGDDEISAVADSGVFADGLATVFNGTPVTLGDSLIGGPGDDDIDLGDGLVSLTGAIKGNEDDDTITIAHATGGTVQGNSGDDSIAIGFSAGFGSQAGSQAEVSLTDASINGSSGDDTITFTNDAELNDSSIRGNEGDDVITIANDVEASGSVSIEGNAGDDVIVATGLTGSATIRGGKGDDTLTVGNGQTVAGGLGADTFIVAAEGGATIEDYDQLDDEGCFCDDVIQIDAWNFDVAKYTVNTDLYTSASSWTGNIKVKAVALPDGDGDTAVARLTKTKTETISAFAVARAFITDTEFTNKTVKSAAGFIAKNQATYGVTYPRIGNFKTGETFKNGNFSTGFNAGKTNANNGIGQAYASAQGLWFNRTLTAKGNQAIVKGLVEAVTAQTSIAFEKGDFSFLQLTATEKVGVAVGQKLLFNDVTNATVKNHWASYVKEKTTFTQTLYKIQLGTAAFKEITTGKAYQIITKGLDTAKVYDTKTITDVDAQATATARLDLDNDFFAWHQVIRDAGSKTLGGSDRTSKTAGGNFYKMITAGNTTKQRVNVGGELFFANLAKSATALQSTGTFKIGNATDFEVFNTIKFGTAKNRQTGTILTNKQLLFTTITGRGLATLTTTAQYKTTAGFIQVTKTVGKNNTNVTQDDYVTATGKLVMKIQASDIATATAGVALGTIVERMTVEGTQIPITTCPEFPTIGTLATNIVDGFAKHGEVTGTFNKHYVFSEAARPANVIFGALTTTAGGAKTLNTSALNGGKQGQGFFSGASFSIDTLVKQSFGSRAVVKAADTDAQNVPFRVLFFDTAGTDNGLYIVSGLANYNDGELTGLRTDAGTVGGSTMAGKHTIVKVTGGKGSLIELSDITFI